MAAICDLVCGESWAAAIERAASDTTAVAKT
jgi:hypothetical protein